MNIWMNNIANGSKQLVIQEKTPGTCDPLSQGLDCGLSAPPESVPRLTSAEHCHETGRQVRSQPQNHWAHYNECSTRFIQLRCASDLRAEMNQQFFQTGINAASQRSSQNWGQRFPNGICQTSTEIDHWWVSTAQAFLAKCLAFVPLPFFSASNPLIHSSKWSTVLNRKDWTNI